AKEGQLVYYGRPDVGGVKESRVLLASIPDAPAVREILSRVLPVKAEVRKTREIFRFQGVQVHLDTVRGLGKFIEFEKVLAGESERETGRKQLESLRANFQIPDDDLMASSYSDLLGSGSGLFDHKRAHFLVAPNPFEQLVDAPGFHPHFGRHGLPVGL